jgi:cytochrome c-type biogenesis protein CcsB
VDVHLANLSNQLMLGTVLLYVVAMIGYAADLGFGRRKAAAQPAAVEAKVLEGSGGPASVTTEVVEGEEPDSGRDWGKFAILFTMAGWGVQLAEIVIRGMAASRIPWGNMYEFTSAITFAAVTVYLIVLVRQNVRFLGAFLMVAVILGLGIATKWLYNDPGPVRPALQSYWIAIHVTAAIIATGTFFVAAITTGLYLLKSRDKSSEFLDRFPTADRLDQLSNRITMFGFPIWTFAIIAGAIWADQAWGSYWQWDPKETWSFVTWVAYAGYLHARATAGWKGRKAAIVQTVAFACLLFNFFGINYLVSGMHSYA